jgi:hypothetical protein
VCQGQQWHVNPLPEKTSKVKNPVQSLNGVWKFNLTPPEEFADASLNDNGWADIVVPGEPAMQGFKVEHDKQIGYRKEFVVPKEFAGQRIFLRFEGVYSYAKIWINGQFVREHFGGFTSWDCEITDHVTAGEKTLAAVGVVDRTDDISYASGYAHHPIGGILRDVYLYCVPENYIKSLDVETELGSDHKDAILKVSVELDTERKASLQLYLEDPSGKKVNIKSDRLKFTERQRKLSVEINVENPLKWDAEHPNLYTLAVGLKNGWSTKERIIQKIGFREVEVNGNKILVNGKQVHLRGACRHDIHPTLGRTSGRELDLKDVLLAKEANVNFIRTSHYPPSKAFLEYCDEYGIYVEEETAVCFVGTHSGSPYNEAITGSQDSPEFTNRYLSQVSEMVDRDRNHACVIIWSVGNENKYGTNFQKSYDLVKEVDKSRPVMFSYPKTTGENICYDIESSHYPTWQGDVGASGHQWKLEKFTRLERPVIADEWAHVACYNYNFDIKSDPGVRNFWGVSLKKMWENSYVSNGTAGGAIWGMIDETFQLPGKCVGYGEWGIYDTWRRKKPEFWLTKKAYSPVRIDESAVYTILNGKIDVPVKNWFDHTDFDELSIEWQVGSETGKIKMPLAPGQEGKIAVPVKSLKKDDVVQLRFYNRSAKTPQLIDEFELPIGVRKSEPLKQQYPVPKLQQNENEIIVSGDKFQIAFDKKNGSIEKVSCKGQTLIVGGPHLNLEPLRLQAFSPQDVKAEVDGDVVKVKIKGSYGTVGVSYEISIDGAGVMNVGYSIANPPADNLYREVGLAFDLVDGVDLLQWQRKGLYSVYPKDHIGRNAGVAMRVSKGKGSNYRKQPDWSWSQDMHDFYYQGKGHTGYGMTHDFRSAKENIYFASISDSQTGNVLRVESDGKSHAVRMGTAPKDDIVDDASSDLIYKANWSTYQDAGNHFGTEKYCSEKGGSVEYAFTGTAIALIGVRNSNCGKADIYLDGKIVQKDLDMYAPSKQYRQVLYSNSELRNGEHVIKVVCTGTKSEKSSWTAVVIDGFKDPDKTEIKGPLRVYINSDWAYALGWGNIDKYSSVGLNFNDTIKIRFNNERLAK